MGRGTVTMSDVAQLAGVSKMTVSNVVNNRGGVSDRVRKRVLEAIRDSGYRLNVSARVLKSGRTGVIGLAVPEIAPPYFSQLAAHVIEAADRHGFHVAVEQTGAIAAGERDVISQSHKLQFDGLILSAVGLDLERYRPPEGDFPIVLLGEQEFGKKFDHVLMANEEGSKAATLHLMDRGCERIAIVTGSVFDRINIETRRHQGYLEAHEVRGMTADPDLRLTLAAMDLESGRAAAHRLADSGLAFDGVVAVTDTVAQGVLRGLADRGIRVPGDVRLIGFDDILESRYMVPALSTVAPDHRWMADKAVELVIARIGEPGRPTGEYFAPFELRVRESTC